MSCGCPRPDLCRRLGFHLRDRLWELYNDDPKYRAFWERQARLDDVQWPWVARALMRLRTADDAGLGDTVARNLARFGADAVKRLYKRLTGADCGCFDRRHALNQKFPYK